MLLLLTDNPGSIKIIEVLSNSYKNWEDATKKVVKEASKSIKSVNVKEYIAIINNDNFTGFMVNLKLTFEVK